jgi:hypothetical protein
MVPKRSVHPLSLSHRTKADRSTSKNAQFFKASTAMRKWAENEYRPVEYYDSATGEVVFKAVPAVL